MREDERGLEPRGSENDSGCLFILGFNLPVGPWHEKRVALETCDLIGLFLDLICLLIDLKAPKDPQASSLNLAILHLTFN